MLRAVIVLHRIRLRYHRINRHGADQFFKPFGMQHAAEVFFVRRSDPCRFFFLSSCFNAVFVVRAVFGTVTDSSSFFVLFVFVRFFLSAFGSKPIHS